MGTPGVGQGTLQPAAPRTPARPGGLGFEAESRNDEGDWGRGAQGDFAPAGPAPGNIGPLLLPPAGVLQVEALAQLGGIVMIDPEDKVGQNNFFFGGVDNVRWKKPVVPGDVLVSLSVHESVEVVGEGPRCGIWQRHGPR